MVALIAVAVAVSAVILTRGSEVADDLERQNVTFDMVYDLLALRVITDTKTHCYAAMGVSHGQWQPVPAGMRE